MESGPENLSPGLSASGFHSTAMFLHQLWEGQSMPGQFVLIVLMPSIGPGLKATSQAYTWSQRMSVCSKEEGSRCQGTTQGVGWVSLS